MSDGDGGHDGMFLNFEVSAPASQSAKRRDNPKSKSFKKHARADAKAKGVSYKRTGGKGGKAGAGQQAAAPRHSTLKGYDLGAEERPAATAAGAAPQAATASNRGAGSWAAARAAHSSGKAARGAIADVQVRPQKQRPADVHRIVEEIGARDLANAAEPPAAGRRRDQDATEAPEPSEAGSPRDEEDIMAAVRLLQKRDAAVQRDLPEGNHPEEAEEREKGVVVFSTDARPVKRRKTHVDRQFERMSAQQVAAEEAAAAKPPPRARVARRAGETAAADVATPAATRSDLFGAVDSSSFEGLGLASSLADHLEAINFSVPTRIQQAVLPVMLAGRDVLASAPTGSGKTLSYIAPLVNHIQGLAPRVTRQSGTHAVVLAPTRELCIQIYDVLSLVLRRYHWVIAGTVYGGENRDKEKSRLRKGVNVLVATPGRLLDHLQNTASFNVAPLHWLVLDEADRLLDLGFEQKIADIVHMLDDRATFPRQTALFSATLHSKLGSLATLSLHDPVAVGFTYTKKGQELVVTGEAGAGGGDSDNDGAPRQFELPKQLRQHFLEVPCKQRLVALAALLLSKAAAGRRSDGARNPAAAGDSTNGAAGDSDGGGGGKIVVFLSTCAGVNFHHALLSGAMEGATGARLPTRLFKLHGNLAQAERTTTFLEFTKSKAGVLLCTDVAARGLDFSAVSSIIQYDPPGEPSEYVHRVGRTARMGHAGEAVLFLLPTEAQPYLQLLRSHNVALQALPLPAALAGLRDPDAASNSLMDAIDGDSELRELASAAFRAFVRAYAAHPASVKDIFHPKKLHLGHVADSFALRDSPAVFGKETRRPSEKKKFKAGRKAAKSGKPTAIPKRAAYS